MHGHFDIVIASPLFTRRKEFAWAAADAVSHTHSLSPITVLSSSPPPVGHVCCFLRGREHAAAADL